MKLHLINLLKQQINISIFSVLPKGGNRQFEPVEALVDMMSVVKRWARLVDRMSVVKGWARLVDRMTVVKGWARLVDRMSVVKGWARLTGCPW